MNKFIVLFFFVILPLFSFSQTDSSLTEKKAGDKYKCVERNRNESILIFGNEIQQGEKIIGTYEERISKEGKTRTIKIYIYNGPRVAEATCEGENSHKWKIVTLKDKANHSVVSKQGNDRRDVIIYLIRTFYL